MISNSRNSCTMARQQKQPTWSVRWRYKTRLPQRGVRADGRNFECNCETGLLRERSGARTHEFPWREWQVDTNQISRTEYNCE